METDRRDSGSAHAGRKMPLHAASDCNRCRCVSSGHPWAAGPPCLAVFWCIRPTRRRCSVPLSPMCQCEKAAHVRRRGAAGGRSSSRAANPGNSSGGACLCTVCPATGALCPACRRGSCTRWQWWALGCDHCSFPCRCGTPLCLSADRQAAGMLVSSWDKPGGTVSLSQSRKC